MVTLLASLPAGASRLLVLTLALVWAAPLLANELVVESRSIRMHDLLGITLTLEGEFAELEGVNIPLRNLAVAGEPWVSSEFAWINGRVSRRKSFRYRARPLAPGPARVGPLTLISRDGRRETLAAVDVQVLADQLTPSNEPQQIARGLEAAGRPMLFLVAEIDRQEVFVGQQILITWALYNAATVQQWQVVDSAQMPDFWVEELEARTRQPESVYVGDRLMQRIPVRRVAVFPLRSGNYTVGGTTVEAAVLQGSRPGPFSIFEGNLVETSFTSAPLTVSVRPLPAGLSVDAVGDLNLQCMRPVQSGGGPLVIGVSIAGSGNLRAATPPRLDGSIEGRLEIEGGEVTVSRGEVLVSMKRDWRYLIFPERTGALELPPIVLRVFEPSTGRARDLRCAAMSVYAVAAALPAERSEPPARATRERSIPWPWLGAILLIGATALAAAPRLRSELRIRREAAAIVEGGDPAAIVSRIETRLPIRSQELLEERSDRGDAWRALRSLLEASQHDRDIAADASREIEHRVRDLLRLI